MTSNSVTLLEQEFLLCWHQQESWWHQGKVGQTSFDDLFYAFILIITCVFTVTWNFINHLVQREVTASWVMLVKAAGESKHSWFLLKPTLFFQVMSGGDIFVYAFINLNHVPTSEYTSDCVCVCVSHRKVIDKVKERYSQTWKKQKKNSLKLR